MGCIASKFEEGALFSAIKTGNVAEARKLIESSQTPLDQILDNKVSSNVMFVEKPNSCVCLRPVPPDEMVGSCAPQRQTLLHKAAKHAQVSETSSEQ